MKLPRSAVLCALPAVDYSWIMTETPRFASFDEFWPFYLAAQATPAIRAVHIVGTALALAFLVLLTFTGNLWFLAAAVAGGCGFAWAGHFLIDGRTPVALRHPVWSVLGDFRMFTLACTGRLGAELRAHKIDRL